MKRYLILTIAFMVVILSSCVVAKPVVKKTKEQILYTQVAQAATLKPILNMPNTFDLYLHNVNNNVIWFTDRPYRKSGAISLIKFIKSWNAKSANSFVVDHPNASLVTVEMGPKVKTHTVGVFELSKPIYNAKKRELIYVAKSVGKIHPPFTYHAHLQEVALFIDNICSDWGIC